MITTNQLREQFLQFFAGKDHQIIPSASLVPEGDRSLLFTNAGMVPFKNYFLGIQKPPHARVTSCQLCMRAGGKHNDLDNVGFTARHHTLFEMLGNFSFGDYFKKQAIHYAWEFLTVTLNIPADRLVVTVYHDDQESYDIWQHDIQVPKDKIVRLGDESNFWQMGDTGPCGPCSEIFYDHGAHVPGGPPGSADEDGNRFVEIWNMVFMQYNRQEKEGELVPLPAPCVDTGMGLERMASVLQGVHDNYQTDTFLRLIHAIDAITRTRPASPSIDLQSASKVIADHIRASVFLLANRVLPDNEGRGYVLRRIIRRALRFGYMMGLEDGFFAPLADVVGTQAQTAYPEVSRSLAQFQATLAQEEQSFMKTLANGITYLQQYFADHQQSKKVDGKTLFTLYDTYGFPADLTEIIAREDDFGVDYAGYEKCMNEQKSRSKQASAFLDVKNTVSNGALEGITTTFTGYDKLSETNSQIVQLFKEDGTSVDTLTDESGMLVLDTSPFYAESGGQIGDKGTVNTKSGSMMVADVQKSVAAHVCTGTITGTLCVGDSATALVDTKLRKHTAANHSATHLLHAALIRVLGSHVEQRGSLVSDNKLRFDFSHSAPLTNEQKQRIGEYVNEQIEQAYDVQVDELAYDDAIARGAKALFSEKYGERVRVLTMGQNADDTAPFSVELCGGTHVANLNDIGFFLITNESALAAGVRRIEAITGFDAISQLASAQATLHKTKSMLQAHTDDDLLHKVTQLLADRTQLAQLTQVAQKDALDNQIATWQKENNSVANVRLFVKQADTLTRKQALDAIDKLKQTCKPAVVLLVTNQADKVHVFCGVDKTITHRMSAKDIIHYVVGTYGGKGGGRNDMAQGGMPSPSNMQAVINETHKWITHKLEESV